MPGWDLFASKNYGRDLQMSFEDAIVVKGLGKCYRTYSSPSHRLKQMFFGGVSCLPMPSHLKNHLRCKADAIGRQFWAVKDVSFTVKRGQILGILGKNGAGKSTLLQLITGTITPTIGSITTHGKIAALLELGSGFNPLFTGLQNVYINASLLGLTREETDEKLHAILDFAEIGDFIHQPIRTYSSGMIVRLAFAVQAQLEPEIMIVDEALSVGDARFQAKCFARLKALVDKGTTILFVSHSTEQIVTHCDSAILLNDGQIIESGEPRQLVNKYLNLLFGKNKLPDLLPIEDCKEKNTEIPLVVNNGDIKLSMNGSYNARPLYNPSEYRWGDGAAEFVDYILQVNGIEFPNSIESDENIEFVFKIYFHRLVVNPIFGFTVKTKEGVTIFGTNTKLQNTTGFQDVSSGDNIFVGVSMPMTFAAGDYFISVGIASQQLDEEIIPHDRRYDSIHININTSRPFFGFVDMKATIKRIDS